MNTVVASASDAVDWLVPITATSGLASVRRVAVDLECVALRRAEGDGRVPHPGADSSGRSQLRRRQRARRSLGDHVRSAARRLPVAHRTNTSTSSSSMLTRENQRWKRPYRRSTNSTPVADGARPSGVLRGQLLPPAVAVRGWLHRLHSAPSGNAVALVSEAPESAASCLALSRAANQARLAGSRNGTISNDSQSRNVLPSKPVQAQCNR